MGGPDHPPPWELLRWSMAERFHWTLEQVDGLSLADLREFFQIEDGRYKANPPPK